MSQYQAIKAATNAYIRSNGRREITGAILNAVMIATIDSLGKYYQFIGNAVPDTNPGDIDQNVAFLASSPGTYTHLGGITINDGEFAVIKFDGEWKKEVVIVIPTKVSELINDLGYITNAVSDLVNYYTKTETDTLLSDFFTKTEVQGILTDYYDKDEVDSIVSSFTRQSYVVAWDGSAAPVVGDIPAGVVVTYGGNPYTGTLAPSASTINKIYLVSNGAGYDEYITTDNSGYAWIQIGTTSLDLSGYATTADLDRLDEQVNGVSLDMSDADVHQVATGSDVDSATGTRLRVIFQVKPGYKVSASCTAGKGLTMNCYDTLSKALKCSSGTSNQLISGGVWIPHCTGVVQVTGYLTISLCKSDSSAFSAQDKQDFLDATTANVWTDSLVSLLPEKPKTEKLIVKRGINLLNPSDPNVLENYYISGGTITAGSGYTTSGYIPVAPSTTYYKASDAEHTLRYVEYYDANKAYISQNTSASSFTTPATCAFVRVSMNSLSWAKAQVSLQDTNYVPYSESLSLTEQTGTDDKSIASKKYVDDSIAAIGVGDLPSIKEKTDELVLKDGVNLLNPADPDVLVDYYIDAGYAYASPGYTSSGWIPVSAETKYYKAKNDPGSFRFVNFYNASKGYLSKTTYSEEFTTPAGCAYVRVSKNSTYWNVAQVAAVNVNYVPYGKYLCLAKQTGPRDDSIVAKKYVDDGLANVASQVFDALRGKKWAVLGDSFTEGATNNTIPDGQYAGHRKVYPYYIGNRTGMDIISTFFASGRTLAFPANPGSFTNSICNPGASCYYQNIPADVDYITIYLGINDSHHSPGNDGGDGEDNTGEIPIGTINDATTATYYGAWNVVLTWLRINRPFAHIGIIVSNGCDDITYRTAQIEVAKKYGIPYLDLNGDDRCPAMIRPQNNDIPSAVKTILLQTQSVDYDGSQTGTINRHPNDAAHEFESYFIETFLRTI